MREGEGPTTAFLFVSELMANNSSGRRRVATRLNAGVEIQ